MIPAADFPLWLHVLAVASLLTAGLSAVAIAIDEVRWPQRMWIMNLVWPLAALFGSLLWLAAYVRWGRTAAAKGGESDNQPFPAIVLKGSSHCGAGCTLGDIIAEWTILALPAVAGWFGYGTLFSREIFAAWLFDFTLAFLFGIGFQYFTIKPIRERDAVRRIGRAVKADILSISAWQVGMYGAMALLQFGVFDRSFGGLAKADTPEFWLAMQAAMLAGFCTAYPVNWLLIRAGVKERM